MIRSRATCCLLVFASIGGAFIGDAAERPNIVIIYADDLGYGDLSIQNRDSKIPTPNLDRLAREGMRLTDAHSSSGICTPSRYAMLSRSLPLAKISFDRQLLGRFGLRSRAFDAARDAEAERLCNCVHRKVAPRV